MAPARALWQQILVDKGWGLTSSQAYSYFRKFVLLNDKTIESMLTRGFAQKHHRGLEALCKDSGYPFEPEIWIKDYRASPLERHEKIRWEGPPVASVSEFYKRLEALYHTAKSYRCLRVGGVFSHNRTEFELDKQGYASKPKSASLRVPYLKAFWGRIDAGSLEGHSVHIIRTIDRLTELWAAVELLRERNLREVNPVYLVAPQRHDARQDYPAMGVRIIDGGKTLLSLPAERNGQSRYSSWIDSQRFAEFAESYVECARQPSDQLTGMIPSLLRTHIESAFEVLLKRRDTSPSNYGDLATFDKVEMIKDRMLEWSRADEIKWLPVIG